MEFGVQKDVVLICPVNEIVCDDGMKKNEALLELEPYMEDIRHVDDTSVDLPWAFDRAVGALAATLAAPGYVPLDEANSDMVQAIDSVTDM